MKKLIGLLLALGLVVAACGDDASDPASMDSCEGLADATIALVQDVIDELGGMSPSEFGEMTQGETPAAFVDIEERGTAIGERAAELECTDIDALVQERADQLTADPSNVMGQLIIEGTLEGEDVMSRLFR